MKKTYISVVSLGTALCMLVGYNVMSAQTWTNAPATPPGSNTAAPINEGTVAQWKQGVLTANTLSMGSGAPILNFVDTTAGQADWRVLADNAAMRFEVDRNDDDVWSNDGADPISISSGATAVTDVVTFSNEVRAAAFMYSSDQELKENITTAPGLAVVEKLRGVSFDWKDSGARSYGLIAQEVESVVPELVSQAGETKSVAYGNIVAFLIEAIKEQQQQIDELEAKVNVSCEK